VSHPAELQLTDLERRVLDRVVGTISIDEIVEVLDVAASQVLATLGVLETRRLVRRVPGNRVERI
jgi:DNA processing protein